MIRYIARIAPVVLHALLDRSTPAVSRLERRVGLADIDTNLHMNQAVYAQVMELGRADLIIRTGALRRWRQAGIKPVVASQRIVYRREIKRGARYLLDTRFTGINGRLPVLQTHLLVGDRVHARADVEVIFIGPDGVLDAEQAEVMARPYITAPLDVVDWQVGAGA